MKKLFLMIVGAFMLSTSLWAKEEIVFSVIGIGDGDYQPIGHGAGRPSIEAPLVYIDDYTLTFEAYHPDYTLIIKDEDGDVVYSTSVYSAQTQVVLPSTLSGDYEIQLVMGNRLFTGWINL
jgi:hypothetical protein